MRLEDLPEIINSRHICDFLHIAQPTLRGLVKRGQFPQPLQSGTRMKLWPKTALESYVGYTPSTQPKELPETSVDLIRQIAREELASEVTSWLGSIQRQLGVSR